MESAKKILIVEDETMFVMLLDSYLKESGHVVTGIAATGEDAIREAAENEPDVIFMDIRLAGAMDGIAAAERILAARRIPIVFMSGYSDEKTLERAWRLGPAAFLEKPILFEELGSVLARLP